MKCNNTKRGYHNGKSWVKEYEDDDEYNAFLEKDLNDVSCASSSEIDKYIRNIEI